MVERSEEANESGNNMPWTVDPPTYNHRYGYNDGAQDDIFIAAPPEPSSSATMAMPYSTLPSSTSGTSDSASSTALPTISTASNGGRGLGVGYRIPRMFTYVLKWKPLIDSAFVCSGCFLRPPECVTPFEGLTMDDVRLQ